MLIQVNKKLNHAEELFNNKNYEKAIQAYVEIVNKFKKCEKGRMRIAQSCFALSSSSSSIENADKLFDTGIYYLDGCEFNNNEIKEIKKYVPDSRIDIFKQILK